MRLQPASWRFAPVRIAALTAVPLAILTSWALNQDLPDGLYASNPLPVYVDGLSSPDTTTVFALAVVQGTPHPLTLALPSGAVRLATDAGGANLESGAGDTRQEASRLAAWAAVDYLSGGHPELAVMIVGGNLGSLPDGSTVLRVDGQPATQQLLRAALNGPGEHLLELQGEEHARTVNGTFEMPPGVRIVPIGLSKPPGTVDCLDGVSGSSSGLALALAYFNAENDRLLDTSARFGVTGMVFPTADTPDGVKEVGGIEQKILGGYHAGLRNFIVPAGRSGALARRALTSHGLTGNVYEASTVSEAIWIMLDQPQRPRNSPAGPVGRTGSAGGCGIQRKCRKAAPGKSGYDTRSAATLQI